MSAKRRTFMIALLGLGTCLAGCQYGAWMLQVFIPNVVQAEYHLPDRRTAVFIDDPRNMLPSNQIKSEIAQGIAKTLVAENVLSETNVIAPGTLIELEMNDRTFRSWSIQTVGQKAGADQIIYVFVDQFDLGQSHDQYRPNASVRIKTYDIQSNQRTYPGGSGVDYRRLNTRLNFVGPRAQSTQSVALAVQQALSQDLARDIARLFFKWEDAYSGIGESRNPARQ